MKKEFVDTRRRCPFESRNVLRRVAEELWCRNSVLQMRQFVSETTYVSCD